MNTFILLKLKVHKILSGSLLPSTTKVHKILYILCSILNVLGNHGAIASEAKNLVLTNKFIIFRYITFHYGFLTTFTNLKDAIFWTKENICKTIFIRSS